MPDETLLPQAPHPVAPDEAADIEPGDERPPADETVPDDAVPDEAVPDDAVPDETVPDSDDEDHSDTEDEDAPAADDAGGVDEIAAEAILEDQPEDDPLAEEVLEDLVLLEEDQLEEDQLEEDQLEEDQLEEGPEPVGDFPTAPLRLGLLTRPVTPPPEASATTAEDALTGEAPALDEDAFAEESLPDETAPEDVLEDAFEDDPLSAGPLAEEAASSLLLDDDRAELDQHVDESTVGDEQVHRHVAASEADLPAAPAAPGAEAAVASRPVGQHASTAAEMTPSVVPSPAELEARTLSPRMRLLYAMRPRATRAQVLALVLCFVLGLAGFLAVRQNQSLGLASMRQSDLVSLLDNVTEKSNRLEDETRRLQETADRLKSGSDKSAAALQAAQQRLELLGILAGTSPAVGSGIQLTITDPQRKVTATTILDTVEELRDAGAEAIQIGDVRVVASTAFVDGDNGVRVDGVEVQRPYVFLVIGDPQTLSAALGIPGGVQEVVKQLGGNGKVDLKQSVTVSALRSVSAPQYAHPATSAAP